MSKFSTLLSACLRAGFCLVLLLSAHASHGQTTKDFSLGYFEKDFQYLYDEDGFLSIYSDKLESHYDTDLNAPALPVFHVSVLLAKNQEPRNAYATGKERVVLKDVMMQLNPVPIPTDEICSDWPSSKMLDSTGVFPKESIVYQGTSIIDGYKVASYKVYPYRYDMDKRNLIFIDDMSFQVELATIQQVKIENDSDYVELSKEGSYVKTLVLNAGELETLYPESKIKGAGLKSASFGDKVDYLIITNNTLAPEFQFLADWKTRKGVRTQIETVENIYTMYPSYSWRSQRKIKQFIYDFYLAHDTEYVLLGGDYDIVPAQGCLSKLSTKTKEGKDTLYADLIPADVYYASFQGNFDWDANNNGIKGEVEDNLVNAIDISVTRAPVRTVYQASTFVDKVIDYERNPPVDTWKNKIFFVGSTLDTVIIENEHHITDALFFSDRVYEYGIQPYWNGTRIRWDGQYSDIGTFPYWILPDKIFCDELETGYSFLDVNGHGSYKSWNLPNYFYHRDSVPNLNNYHPLIVVTSACHTNAFDNLDDPCLSEALIRSYNSGVVAYLGSSRYGWYHKYKVNNHPLGASDTFNKNFYRKLFSNPNENKNFGLLVKETKKNSQTDFYNSYTAERWLRFSINPIGDAEMPIYVDTPKQFQNVVVDNSSDSTITIYTGVDSCRVCLMDMNGGSGLYQVENNINTVSINNAPEIFSLCISKQGYATYSCVVRRSSNSSFYLQNENIRDCQYITAQKVYIGDSVTNEKPHGNVVITKGRVEVNANETIMEGGFEVKRGAELIVR
ncbi:MAG: hypothetical protein J6M41_05080 [Prevotella sp.]|nr:hypothetical protein [Prevotella sp.]